MLFKDEDELYVEDSDNLRIMQVRVVVNDEDVIEGVIFHLALFFPPQPVPLLFLLGVKNKPANRLYHLANWPMDVYNEKGKNDLTFVPPIPKYQQFDDPSMPVEKKPVKAWIKEVDRA